MLAHNKQMQDFLSQHGIEAIPKWITKGSLQRTWRLYNKKTKWSEELAAQLNGLGFVDYAGKPLGKFSGNGGMFCVFVRRILN